LVCGLLCATFLIFGPVGTANAAFSLDLDPTDNNNALGIRNLELDGVPYNVEFQFGSSNEIYGLPPQFDFTAFNAEEQIAAAMIKVNTALNSDAAVQTVGPAKSDLYNIGGDWDPNNSGLILALASAYNDRTLREWDTAKEESILSTGVRVIPISKLDTYAKFTVVPLPSAVWLLGSGLLGVIGFRRKRPTT
jgi:hypothetical protein